MIGKVGYARSSVGDPEGLTHEIQLDRLKAAGCDYIFSEVISGNASHRPQWERLKRAIQEGLVTEVVAIRMDRLSRSWTAIGEVVNLFSKDGAPKLSLLDEPHMDLQSIGGRTVAGVLASVAAGERERIVARAKAGLKQRFASGRRIKIPFGVAKDPSGFPIVDRRPMLSTINDKAEHSHADVARAIWTAWEETPTNYSAGRFALERFGIQGFRGGSAVTWCLNPVLRGALTSGTRNQQGLYSTVVEDQFEPLIEPDRHKDAVAVYLRGRANNNRGTNAKATPLSGKVRCSACGYSMTLHRILTRNVEATFRCRRVGCENEGKRIRYSILLEAVRQHLLQRQESMFQVMCGVFQQPEVDKDLEAALDKAEDDVKTLRQTFMQVPTDDISRALQKAEAKLAELQAERAKPKASTIDPAQIVAFLPTLIGAPIPVDEDGNMLFRKPDPNADPMEGIRVLLQPSQFKSHEESLIPLTLHHLKVNAVTKEVTEVVDLMDAIG